MRFPTPILGILECLILNIGMVTLDRRRSHQCVDHVSCIYLRGHIREAPDRELSMYL